MELAYAALHQLCLPLLDGVDRLPGPQAGAVATIFGLRAGAAPGTFLVGLGVLNLLAEAARVAPARAHLVYGEWLRQEQRVAEARVQLRTAYEMFATMGAEAFAARTRLELIAAGETVPTHMRPANAELTTADHG